MCVCMCVCVFVCVSGQGVGWKYQAQSMELNGTQDTEGRNSYLLFSLVPPKKFIVRQSALYFPNSSTEHPSLGEKKRRKELKILTDWIYMFI